MTAACVEADYRKRPAPEAIVAVMRQLTSNNPSEEAP
jgi:hypothetical protein